MKKLFKWAVIILLALVVLPIAGLAFFISSFDPNPYRADIAKLLSEQLARPVALRGAMQLSWQNGLSLSIKDAEIGNPAGFSGAPLAQVGELRLQLALAPLLQKQIAVQALNLHQAQLNLQQNGKQQNNYSLPQAGKTNTESAASSKAVSLSVDTIAISDSSLMWQAATGKPIKVTLSKLDIAAAGDLILAAAGTYNNQAFNISAKGGALYGWEQGDWPIKITGQALGQDFSLDSKLRYAAQNLASAATNIVFGDITYAGAIDYAAQKLSLRNFTLQQGNLKAEGNIQIDMSGARPKATGRLNVAPYIVPAAKDASDAASTAAPAQFFSREKLDLAMLREIDADIAVTIDSLQNGVMRLKQIRAPVQLSNGRLSINPLTANLGKQLLTSNLLLDARSATGTALAFSSSGKQINLQQLWQSLAMEPFTNAAANLAIDVRGQGASVHDIAASLDGSVGFAVGQGDLYVKGLEWLSSDIAKIIWPSALTQKPELKCLIMELKINNGQAQLQPFALDTTQVSLQGEGTIDLGAETLDLLFKPDAKDTGLAQFMVPVRVRGTLSSPSYGPDAGATLQKLAGFAFGVGKDGLGGSLLSGLLGGNAEAQSPCLPKAQQPSAAPVQIERAQEAIKGIMQNLGQGLFGGQ